VVIEAGDPGQGCSTRNGAQVSHSVKPSRAALARRFGEERARAMRAEGPAALAWVERLVAEEGIDCGFRRSGRVLGAHSPAAFRELRGLADRLRREEDLDIRALPRPRQREELGTDAYHGALVYAPYATLHPARYHRGLLERSLGAGATVVPHCPATAIRPEGGGFAVDTPRGTVRVRDVAVATNGYTSALTPWLRRRVIPIGSYVIATEPLPRALMDRLFPTGRMACDTRRVIYYYGPTPDRSRIVFGGRVSAGEIDDRVAAPRLHAEMARLFPELRETRISHAWHGTVAYSFDSLPHTGRHEGVHYALGYCGSGVSLSGYLGMRMGQKILGLAEGRTAFDDLPFPTRPLYAGRPWFLPAAVAWYRLRDRADALLPGG
jgi:glycine/D-amino acid oxidase-like deaminating enzyme